MSFGTLDTSDVKRIVDYGDAMKHEARITPIRGSTLKPYGKRTRKHLSTFRDGADVVVRLYSTDIIRYKPDNKIIVNFGGWGTQSTIKFIEAILGVSLSRRHGQVWLYQGGVEYPLSTHRTFEVQGSPYSYSARYTPTEPVMRYTLNKKAYNQYKKEHYANFINYLIGIWRLRNETSFTVEEAEGVFGTQYYEVIPTETLGEWMRDEELWGKAAVVILRRCGKYEVHRWASANSFAPVKVKKSRIDDEIKHTILAIHAHEAGLIKQTEYTGGKMFRDEYAQYMR